MKDMIKNEKPLMWYKVRELSGKMNKTQVGICLGIYCDTVRSYLSSLDECPPRIDLKISKNSEYLAKALINGHLYGCFKHVGGGFSQMNCTDSFLP